MKKLKLKYAVVPALALKTWHPVWAHVLDHPDGRREVLHTLWENKDRTFHVTVGGDKPGKGVQSWPVFRAKVKAESRLFVARFPDTRGEAHKLEHEDKATLAKLAFALFLGYQPTRAHTGQAPVPKKKEKHRIVPAQDTRPWTRTWVWVLEQPDGSIEPLHTLWAAPGQRFVVASGLRRPDKDASAREAFTVRDEGGLSVVEVADPSGKKHRLASADHARVVGDAFGIFLSGKPPRWEDAAGKIDKGNKP